MAEYTRAEYADLIFEYGRVNGNSRQAHRLYRASYPPHLNAIDLDRDRPRNLEHIRPAPYRLRYRGRLNQRCLCGLQLVGSEDGVMMHRNSWHHNYGALKRWVIDDDGEDSAV
ncbi:hypothetical protein ANN_11164 [Periplaneta americana]|uniref:DUF4817 domain-containing protein n=1 Tax=Periplaneta americana TaxID=6978 RepID=A0ABQ8T491_PERAM|nr:hypothetical protein ANN_11164 [Periplaneta americana]